MAKRKVERDMGAGWLGRCTTCGGGVWEGDIPYRPDGDGYEHEICFSSPYRPTMRGDDRVTD